MAKIILKKSSVAGKVPLTSDLSLGEVAVNTADGSLYTLSATSTILKLNKSLSFLPGDVTYLPVASNTIEYRGDNLFLRAGYSLESDSIAFVTTGLNNFNVTKIVPLTVNGVFKVYACTTAGLYDSTNGIKWNKVSTEVFINFAYETGTGRYYGLVTGGASSKYSTDFVTWTAGTYAGTYHTQVYPIAYGLELFTITGGILQISSNNGTTYNSLGTAACNGAILVDTYIIEYSSTGIKYSNVLDNPNSLSTTGVSFDSALNTGFTYADNDSVIKYTNASTTAYTSTDGINYSTVTITNNGNINKVIKAKMIYYIATDTGLLSSTDGVTFSGTLTSTSGTIPYGTSLKWGGVAYNGSKYLVILSVNQTGFGHYATSTDKITWTLGTFPTTFEPIDDPMFSNGKFCVVDRNSATAYTSPDAVTWTTVTLPGVVEGVALCGTVIVAVKYSSNSSYRSTDGGSTWTTVALPGATTVGWCNVMYNGSRIVVTSFGDNKSAYSDNLGVTWTAGGALPATSTTWVKGTASSSVFLITISSGNSGAVTNIYATSSDGGVTWTARTFPTSEWIYRLCFGNGYFVTGLGTKSSYWYSADGITWSVGSLPSTLTQFTHNSFANGSHFITQEAANSTILSSSTPTAWSTASTSKISNLVVKDVLINTSLTLLATTTGIFSTATDVPTSSSTFTSRSAVTSFTKLVLLNNTYFAFGGANGIYSSTDGITWTQRLATVVVNNIIYQGTLYTASTTTGIYTSTDGVTWTSVLAAVSVNSVEYLNNSIYVAATTTGIYTSTNGSTYTQKLASVSVIDTTYANLTYVASTTTGIYTSSDAATWTKKSSTATATVADLKQFKDVIILNNGEYFLPFFALSLPASTPKLGSTHVPYICIK